MGGLIDHAFESKTNILLIMLVFVGLVAVIIAAALFGQELWSDFLDLIKVAIGGGTLRAATNDGFPNAVRMYKGRDSVSLEGQPTVIEPPEQLVTDQMVAQAAPHPQTFPPFPGRTP